MAQFVVVRRIKRRRKSPIFWRIDFVHFQLLLQGQYLKTIFKAKLLLLTTTRNHFRVYKLSHFGLGGIAFLD